MDTKTSGEPDCLCPQLERGDWDLKKHEWGRRAFYRKKHHQFMHMPIGISGAIENGMREIEEKGYTVKPPYMMLDDETGFFTAEILIAIEEIPEDDPDVIVWEPSVMYSKFHHGPFRDLKQSIIALNGFVSESEGSKPSRIYMWTSNCPKCWERDGAPTVVLLAKS